MDRIPRSNRMVSLLSQLAYVFSLILVVIAACDDPVKPELDSPEDIFGYWRVTTVNGDSLPLLRGRFAIAPDGDTLYYDQYIDTLGVYFEEPTETQGSFLIHVHIRNVPVGAGQEYRASGEDGGGVYTYTRPDVELTELNGGNIIDPVQGRAEGDGMMIQGQVLMIGPSEYIPAVFVLVRDTVGR